jgi:hypothetical protein
MALGVFFLQRLTRAERACPSGCMHASWSFARLGLGHATFDALEEGREALKTPRLRARTDDPPHIEPTTSRLLKESLSGAGGLYDSRGSDSRPRGEQGDANRGRRCTSSGESTSSPKPVVTGDPARASVRGWKPMS